MPDEIMRPLTKAELKEREDFARQSNLIWFGAYLDFPTKSNLERVVREMEHYQFVWMNGRER